MKRKAFTLIELLVVISIIALLVAILVPSLRAAMDLARLLYCKTTISALTKSVLVYTEANRGYMMVYVHDFHEVGGKRYIQAPRQPNLCSVAFTSGDGINPLTGKYVNARNYGLLDVAGLLQPPKMFYCAGKFNDPKYVFDNYPKPWGSGTVSGSRVHVGYVWNPWVTILAGSGEQVQTTFDDELLLERHPPERFLTTDILGNADTMSHQMGNSAVWNHGFPDGHVEGREYPRIYARFVTGLEARVQWKVYHERVQPGLEAHP